MHRFTSKRKGQSVVEFALVATLFIGFIIALFSMVDVLHLKTVADNAVREAGRRAIFNYDGNDEALQLLKSMVEDNKTLMGATCSYKIDGPNDSHTALDAIGFNDKTMVASVDCDVPIFLIGQSLFGRPSLHVHSEASFNWWNPGIMFLMPR